VGGAEIYFRPAGHYDLAREGILFKEIEKAVSAHGDTALGVWKNGEKWDQGAAVELNPPKDSVYALKGEDRIVVLSTYV
jgi:hypothetical protein